MRRNKWAPRCTGFIVRLRRATGAPGAELECQNRVIENQASQWEFFRQFTRILFNCLNRRSQHQLHMDWTGGPAQAVRSAKTLHPGTGQQMMAYVNSDQRRSEQL